MLCTIVKENVDPNSNAGDLFNGWADKFYYGTASIQADPRSPVAFIWSWSNGLSSKQVPPQIFNDLMAMRFTEHALLIPAFAAGSGDRLVAGFEHPSDD